MSKKASKSLVEKAKSKQVTNYKAETVEKDIARDILYDTYLNTREYVCKKYNITLKQLKKVFDDYPDIWNGFRDEATARRSDTVRIAKEQRDNILLKTGNYLNYKLEIAQKTGKGLTTADTNLVQTFYTQTKDLDDQYGDQPNQKLIHYVFDDFDADDRDMYIGDFTENEQRQKKSLESAKKRGNQDAIDIINEITRQKEDE